MKKDGIIKPIVVLVGICFVVSGLLALVYSVANPIIVARAAEEADQAKAVVLPDGSGFSDYDGTKVDGVSEVFVADNGAGIVCTTTPKGFAGNVDIMVGVNNNGEITGMQVLNHGETPGVGTNALTPEYMSQFIGLTGGDTVDAYSGATYSSKAVKSAANIAVTQYAVTQGAEYEAPVELTEDELIAQKAGEMLGAYEEVTGAALEENVIKVFKSTEGKGYAVLAQGVGHYPEDPFRLLVGVGEDGAVTGIATIFQNETLGFGFEVLDEGTYFEQFVGATAITRKSSGEGTKIDVVAGSTETSVGAYDCVKAALKQFAALQ